MPADVWYVRGEGGAINPMVPPFGEGIAARLRSGALVRVNADGSLWTAPAPVATPDPAVTASTDPSDPAPKPDEPDEAATLAEKRAAEELAEQAATRVPLPRPERDARKGVWVAYAASTGTITTAAAEDLTKAELVERFGR